MVNAGPHYHNGAPICKPIENAYIHCDLSSYGWVAVLNNCVEAWGLWIMPDLDEHITFKKLKAGRCAIKPVLPELKGK